MTAEELWKDSDLFKSIQSLGESPEEVCKTLTDKNIKGDIKRCRHCPIANYLKSEGFLHPECNDIKITAANREGKLVYVGPTAAVSHFIKNFDNGKYPELVNDWNNEDMVF